MLGMDVTPADVQDRDGFLPLLKRVRHLFVFLERLFADGAYSGMETAAAAKRIGKVSLEIVKRSDAAKGFVVLPKQWIVEKSFGGAAAAAAWPRIVKTSPALSWLLCNLS